MMPSVLNTAFTEEAVVFGADGRLVGVVTDSAADRSTAAHVAVVFLNAGVVHRVGPSRLYVNLARQLSRLGVTSFRFDHSGIGDSQPRVDDLAFEQSSVSEAIEAIDWLVRERRCQSFILVGLCSGTLTAFRTALVDARVKSLVLLTALLVDPSTVPEHVVAEAAERRVARSYLVEKIVNPSAWKRILARRTDYRRVWSATRRLVGARVRRTPPAAGESVLVDQIRQLLDRGVSLQFIYAEPTTVLEWFRMTLAPTLASLRSRGRLDFIIVRHADHTFTEQRHQAHVVELVSEWVRRCI
jgi:alpha/beta superfamily hydrolase